MRFMSMGEMPKHPKWHRSCCNSQTRGSQIQEAGMRFNAGHALNYYNVQPVATLQGVRELHIGHSIVSRSVLIGMRDAVREMKTLIREMAR